MNHSTLAQQLRHLVIFKNLREHPLISALAALLESDDNHRLPGACYLAAEV